jgi:hypothetical protein
MDISGRRTIGTSKRFGPGDVWQHWRVAPTNAVVHIQYSTHSIQYAHKTSISRVRSSETSTGGERSEVLSNNVLGVPRATVAFQRERVNFKCAVQAMLL